MCIGYLTSSYDVTTQPANGVTNVNSKQSLSDEEDDEYHRKGNKSKGKTETEELQDELVILEYLFSSTIILRTILCHELSSCLHQISVVTRVAIVCFVGFRRRDVSIR